MADVFPGKRSSRSTDGNLRPKNGEELTQVPSCSARESLSLRAQQRGGHLLCRHVSDLWSRPSVANVVSVGLLLVRSFRCMVLISFGGL